MRIFLLDKIKLRSLNGNNSNKNESVLEPLKINLNKNHADYKKMFSYSADKSFLIRVKGDSMVNAGISSGDIVLVNKTTEAENGDIIMASVNEHLVIKRLHKSNGMGIILIPENPAYEIIRIKPDDNFEICGVVKTVIKNI
ncbi:MAG: peptidase S24 [Bacteroidetes bacterium]|nr:MAG: peptidase S24 [Bacteroidota bacterium]